MSTNPKRTTTILGLPYPVVALAPMDGITDSPFRQITKKYGNPDVLFTEFTHVKGLCVAGHNTIDHFHYEEIERPIVAQIYGQEPEYFYHAAKVVIALGFEGVDINMGCPAKKVSGSGAGAALIKTPDLAKEIVYEVQRGIHDWVGDGKLTGLRPKAQKAIELKIKDYQLRIIKKLSLRAKRSKLDLPSNLEVSRSIQNLIGTRTPIPVSIKTRIGYDKPITDWWIKELSTTKPAWISVHGRVLKQMYSGKADWDQLKIAVDSTDIPIMVNGDVKEYGDIQRILDHTGAEGVLVGRASFGNPWIFSPLEGGLKGVASPESVQITMPIMLEHAKLFYEFTNHSEQAFVQMRKHFGWYCKGFDGAKELRMKLVRVKNLDELIAIIEGFST